MADTTGTTIDSLAIEINSNAGEAVDGIKKLSDTLSGLKTSLRGGIGLTAVVKQLSNVNDVAKKIDSGSVGNVSKLADALNKLKSANSLKLSSSVSNQLAKLGNVAKDLTGVDFSQIGKLGDALQSINTVSNMKLSSSIANQLSKIGEAAETLNSVDFSGVERLGTALTPLAEMSDGNLATLLGQLKQLKSAAKISSSNSKLDTSNWLNNLPIIKQLTSAFQKLQEGIQKAAKSTASFSWTELVSKFTVLKGVIQSVSDVLAQAVNSTNEYVESFNLFNVSLGEYAQAAQEYAETAADAVGVDPAEWLKQQGVFNTIIEGFGVASDRAIVMSQNLTQLGYDLSSFFNIGTDEAFQKLESGISGELEPLRRLGYDLSTARLEQERLNLGIETSVNDMTQAQKSQLRYYAIMTQVTDAQGDMARTLSSPSNQLRVLKAQVEQCARAFGNIFIPVLNAVLPYVIAFAKVVRMAAQEIANFFGYELPEVDYSTSITNSSSAMDDLTDSTNKATQAAKKLKSATIGIDELNVISPNDDSSGGSGSGSGSGGSGGDLDFDLPTYDFLEGLTESRVNQIAESMMNTLRDAFENEDWQSLGEFIGSKINQAMEAIPWADSGTIAGKGINGLVQTLYYTLDTADWNKLGTHFAELVNNALAQINFNTAGRLFTKSFTILPDIIIGFLQELNWSLVGKSFSNFVMGALQEGIEWLDKYNWSDLGRGLAEDIQQLWNGIEWDGVANRGFTLFTKAIKDTWDFANAFLEAFDMDSIQLVWGNGTIFDAIFGDTASQASQWVQENIAKPFSDALGSELQANLGTVLTITSGVALAIGAMLALSGADIGLGIGLIARGAVGLAASYELNNSKVSTEVSKQIGIITGIVGGAELAVGAILAITGVNIPLGLGLIAGGAATLGTAVSLNKDAVVDTVKQGIDNLLSVVEQGKENLAKARDNVVSDAQSFATNLGQRIAEAKENVQSWASEKWNGFENNFSTAVNTVVSHASTFKTNLDTKLNDVKSSIDTWGKNVKSWFEEHINLSTFQSAAKNLVDGFVQGIEACYKTCKDAITGWAGNIEAWFKEKLGIHSPSKVFEKLGLYTVEGYANGIVENTFKAVDSVIEMGNEVVSAANSSIDKLNEVWDNCLDNATKHTPKLVTTITKGLDTCSTSVSKLSSNVNTLGSNLSSLGEKFGISWLSSVGEFVSGVGDAIDTITTLIDTVRSAINTVEEFRTYFEAGVNFADEIFGISSGNAKAWSKDIVQNLANGINKNKKILSQALNNVLSFSFSQFTGSSLFGSSSSNSEGSDVRVANILTSGINVLDKVLGTGFTQISTLFNTVGTFISSIYTTVTTISTMIAAQAASSVASNAGSIISGVIKVIATVASFFAAGGGIFPDNFGAPTLFANGGNATHGSLFVAGEAGSELVGHINGQTEVMNQFQIAEVMQSAVFAGMHPYVAYWESINQQLATCTNAVVSSNLETAEAVGEGIDIPTYTPASTLSQDVYDSATTAGSDGSDEDIAIVMRSFYTEYVEPTLKQIATDTKRQADKDEKTVVQLSSRTLAQAVTTQQKANGYVFAK